MNTELSMIALQVQAAARRDKEVNAAVSAVHAAVRREIENVDADNPYGCNQYGEGWAEPHNGNSTAYRNMSPFKKDAPKRKVLTSERDGSTTDEVTFKKRVGKGDYQGGEPAARPGKREVSKKKETGGKEKAENKGTGEIDGIERHYAKIDQSLGRAAANRFRMQMEAADPDVRAAFLKYADMLDDVHGRNGRGVSYCRMGYPPSVYINADHNDADNEFRTPGQTYLHEQGHAIDSVASHGTGGLVSSKLNDSIKEDMKIAMERKRKELATEMQSRANDIIKEIGSVDMHDMNKDSIGVINRLCADGVITRAEGARWYGSAGKELPAVVQNAIGDSKAGKGATVKVTAARVKMEMIKELNMLGKNLASVCDAYGANGMRPSFSHSASYYRRMSNAGALETFANLYATYAINDKEQIRVAEKYLPNTTKAFKKILKEIV